jgi:hypothetical protein
VTEPAAVSAVPAVPVFAPPTEPGDLPARIGAVAKHLEGARHVTGRRGLLAVLRRLVADSCVIPPEAFWSLEAQFHLGTGETEERFWMRLLPLMARHPHDGAVGPGLALARGGVTAPRMERWLRADHDDAWAQAPRLLARVRDAGIDWVRTGMLLRFWKPEQRRAVAREFFRSPEYRNRSSAS